MNTVDGQGKSVAGACVVLLGFPYHLANVNTINALGNSMATVS